MERHGRAAATLLLVVGYLKDRLNGLWCAARRGGPARVGHGATRPVGVPLGLGVQRQLDDLGDLLPADRGLAAASPADLIQLGQPVLGEPVPPRADGADRDPEPLCDVAVGYPVGHEQQCLCLLDLPVRRGL
jgi:hypothetical protein